MPEGRRNGNSRHPCSRPIKDTKHGEPHKTDTDEKHYRQKLQAETDQRERHSGHSLQKVARYTTGNTEEDVWEEEN